MAAIPGRGQPTASRRPGAAPRVWSAGSVLHKSLGPAASLDPAPGGRSSLALTAPPSANRPNASRQPAQVDRRRAVPLQDPCRRQLLELVASAEPAEELPHIADQQVGCFHG